MKQDDRFFRLMHAVDDDLLEEAMQPVRRRSAKRSSKKNSHRKSLFL